MAKFLVLQVILVQLHHHVNDLCLAHVGVGLAGSRGDDRVSWILSITTEILLKTIRNMMKHLRQPHLWKPEPKINGSENC